MCHFELCDCPGVLPRYCYSQLAKITLLNLRTKKAKSAFFGYSKTPLYIAVVITRR